MVIRWQISTPAPGFAVAGRAEISDPHPFDDVDRLGDHAVLEHRLGEEEYIIRDHACPGVGEIDDALGKTGLTFDRRVKSLAGPRGDVMDYLHHAPGLNFQDWCSYQHLNRILERRCAQFTAWPLVFIA
jgi:hypothetical protein